MSRTKNLPSNHFTSITITPFYFSSPRFTDSLYKSQIFIFFALNFLLIHNPTSIVHRISTISHHTTTKKKLLHTFSSFHSLFYFFTLFNLVPFATTTVLQNPRCSFHSSLILFSMYHPHGVIFPTIPPPQPTKTKGNRCCN